MNQFLAASALLLCFACAREELGTDDRIVGGHDNASEMIFSAVSPSTKTMMGESVEGKRPVYWSEGDKICVNGVVSDPLEGVSENATAAVFRVGSGLDAPFKGLYPASFYTDASTITLPSVQTWESGSFANGSFPMASYTQDQREEMAFRFLCSMLKLSIKQDSSQGAEADEIASVVFRGNDGEQVSGAFTIDYQNATLSSVSSSDNDKIVGMIVNQPLSADKALDIYLVVPARVYDAGFTLSITDAQGRVMKKSSNKSQTLKAGIIAKLPEFVFVPNAEGGDDPIPEDLIPQEGDVTEDGEPVVMYFGARIDNGEGDDEGTKTHLGTPSDSKYPNLWTVGDKVAINGVASASLPEANISNEGKRARFPMAQVVDKYAGYYYVGYPYTDGSTSGFTGFSNGTGTVIIPSEQTYTDGTYDPRAFVLIGKSTTQVMTFTPKMALLRVTPTNSDTPYAYKISKVRLESIGGEAMSGTFTTNFENSFEATSGVSYIEINAPTDEGLDFGNPFFFMIPAQTYSKGLRFIVYTKDGKSMTFSNGSSYTAEYRTSRSISSPKYTPSVSGSVSCNFLTSSSAGFSWSGGNASNNVKKPWRLAIYNNEECTSLKVAYNISETGEADGDVWYQQEGTPHYIVGGLTPGTTYYCQVTDVNNNIAMEPISFTTDSFTPIAPSSPVGSVLLAENFGEFGHGSATLGGYSGHRYAGWAPRSTSSISNSVNCAAPTGEVTTGVSLPHDVQLRMVEGFDFTTAPRFYDAGWGFTADALDLEEGDDKETIPSVYSQPGAIRFGKSNNHRIFLVLPALTGISSGKYATVDVTIKASRTVARDISHNNQLAVFLEDDLSMTNTDQRLYSTPSLTRAYPITMTKYGYDSEVNTVRIDGVQNTDHLIIGTYANVNERNRFQIYSVTVTWVSESDVETFDITDDVSLRTFYARVDGGEKSLNAKVLADVTASSTTADDWTPLGTPNDPEAESSPYTGTFEGNDKTITGLTKPFFADLQGTVQNLTLNSTVSSTDRALHFDALAIFAEKLTGGTLSSCTSAGSVTYTPSEAIANGTRLVAGIVGQAASGTISGCINNATLSVPAGSVSGHDAIIEVGGIVARLGESNTSNASCSNSTNTGSISVGIDGSGSHNLATRIGGVIGYVINRKSSAPVLSALTNKGTVQYSGICGGQLSVGGVVGYMYENGNNHTNSTLSGCANHASVTVTSEARVATQNNINVAGIAAVLSNAMNDCNNYGNISNSGTFSGTKSNICIGGIAGNSKGFGAISNSHNYNSGSLVAGNTGTVQNAGAGNIIAIGGLAGWSNGGTSYTSACSNAGSVSNSGQGYDTTAGVRIGGLVGCADGNNNLSGGNYNQGTVTEQSSTATSYVAIGGVCGFANNASTSLASAQNKSGGTVTLSLASKSISLGRVGGVLGYASEACTLNGASNAAAINVKTTTTSDTLYVGGLLGYGLKSCTLAGISNSGKLTIQNQSCISLYAGGLVGFNKGAITGSSSNAAGGQIAISSLSSSDASYIGGLVGYTSGSITGTSGTKIENNGSITTGGSVANHLYLGGITGYNKAALSYCTNKGAINNSIKTNVTGGKDINIGGVSGLVNAALSNCSNSVAVVNTSSGDSKVDICIGGVIGNNKGYTMTSCSNTGSVSNAGDGGILAVGGLAGWSGASSTYASVCSNSGAISNSGLASNSTAGVRMGGLVGCANSANTFTGESGNYNYNNGPLTETSASAPIAIGGIVGFANSAETDLAYSRNNGAGDITIQGNSRNSEIGIGGIVGYITAQVTFNHTQNAGDILLKDLTMQGAVVDESLIGAELGAGGIVGYIDVAYNSKMEYLTNSGNITLNNIQFKTTKNSVPYVGGIIGRLTTAASSTTVVENCSNSGAIQTAGYSTNGWNSSDLITDVSDVGYGYFAGIAAASDKTGYQYKNCTNTGDILLYSNLKLRVGGIASYSNKNPSDCTCIADVNVFRQYEDATHGNCVRTSGANDVGGILAYCNRPTFTRLKFDGTIKTTGSTPHSYVGGLIGETHQDGTFNTCKVGGSISGAGASTQRSGLFCSTNATNYTMTFTSCILKTGVKWYNGSSVTVTSSNVTAEMLIGEKSGTVYNDVYPSFGSID